MNKRLYLILNKKILLPFWYFPSTWIELIYNQFYTAHQVKHVKEVPEESTKIGQSNLDTFDAVFSLHWLFIFNYILYITFPLYVFQSDLT